VYACFDNFIFYLPKVTSILRHPWQTKFRGKLSDAHTVIPMTISISPQGKVLGISEQNQCRMKGIASPGVVPTSLSLDVTLSGCNYKGYNLRMSGYLNLNAAQKQAQLSLNRFVIHTFGRGSEQYDIRATMRR
jgi:predicted membrane-bound mannosyltransferase